MIKKIMIVTMILIAVISIAFSWIMSAKLWKDFLIGLICSFFAAGVVCLIGATYHWSNEKVLLGMIIVSGYARPIVFGINRQIKEFFKDPKSFIEKYRSLK